MAILYDVNFKGFAVKAYISLEHFHVQKQYNKDADGNEAKLWTITADIFFWKEPDKINLLESKMVHLTTPTLDGLETKSIFGKIKEIYPGDDVLE